MVYSANFHQAQLINVQSHVKGPPVDYFIDDSFMQITFMLLQLLH